jgi:hypothetical protein
MRRIYESGALRHDDDPFSPGERDAADEPQAIRWIDATALSRRLLPDAVRDRAVSVEVSTPRTEYASGEWIPFGVTMRNSIPFPITFRTVSPIPWSWSVDGVREASLASLREPPAESGEFRFGRGERKRFTKRWTQTFRVSKSEWERVEPGEYTIRAGLNVENASERGLYDEVTVRVVPGRE